MTIELRTLFEIKPLRPHLKKCHHTFQDRVVGKNLPSDAGLIEKRLKFFLEGSRQGRDSLVSPSILKFRVWHDDREFVDKCLASVKP